MKNVNFLLFDRFETLDLFGPVEVFGQLKADYQLNYYSIEGGIITSDHSAEIMTKSVSEIKETGILIVPGGQGTRTLVSNQNWIAILNKLCLQAENVLTICTGSALLAQTGLLDKKKATSNKKAMEWVVSTAPQVFWQKKARWVVDDKYYTSSGISAGIDMALGFISDKHGRKIAEKVAKDMEYVWNDESDKDPFAVK